MRVKRFGLVGGFFILAITIVIILFNTSIASAQPPPPMTCFDDSECFSGTICINGVCKTEGDIILRLSSATNAHGETTNGGGSYQFGISYSSIFGGAGSGDRTCTGANKVVGISSATNAHAESPGQSNYATEVCYEGLSCAARPGGCQVGESLVVSLSSSTNAHLSNSAGYGVDICCVIGEPIPSDCGDGNTDTATEECDDGNTDNGDGCSSTCQIEPSGECNNNNVMEDNDPNIPGEFCDGTDLGGETCMSQGYDGGDLACDNTCSFDISPCTNICDLTSASWSTPSGGLDVVEETNVGLIIEGNDCDGETVSFEVWEDEFGLNDRLIDTRPGDHIPPIDVAFNGTTATGNWVAEWFDDGYSLIDRNSDPEYYFGAITTSDSIASGTTSADELHVTEYFVDPDLCATIVMCGDYDNVVNCNVDGCNVADVSGGHVNCNDPNRMCACSWIGASSSCNATWAGFAGGVEIGECTYSQNTGDNCDDGFLTFAWTANWIWAVGNEVEQNDPENLFGECIDGSRTIECPAQIPLPFFGAYNFIVALIIIALIYVLWGSGSRKNRKKK